MPKTTDYVSTLFDNDNNPSKVTIALTMAGKALEKGHSATIILMVDGVRLAVPNAFGKIDIGAPFKPAAELLKAFMEKGGQLLVCGACLKHNGIEESAIDERFEIIDAGDVIDLVMSAKGSLQLS